MVSINDRYHGPAYMTDTAKAKLFMHGRSQAVRLPKEFRMPGTEVKISRLGRGVLIEPLAKDWEAIFAKLDTISDGGGFEDGWRDQPPMPPDKKLEFD